MLEVSSSKYLLPLLHVASSKRADQRFAAMRAIAALCKPLPNRAYVHSAGFLPFIESSLAAPYDQVGNRVGNHVQLVGNGVAPLSHVRQVLGIQQL